MKSQNPSAVNDSTLSDSNFVSNHPFIWGNIALIAGVPWLLAWSMAGLAVGDPVFPTWLEILLLGFPAIALGAWLQWQQPFSPFSIWFVAKPPEDLSENERRVLTLIKQQRNGWYVTGWIAIAIAFVMSAIFCKIYIAAPLAEAIAPFPAGLRLFGIVWAEVCFLLSNILLQSGVSALRIKLTAESELASLQPFAVERIKNSFTNIGWRSPQLLKFFEDEPEVPNFIDDKQEESNDALLPETSEEPQNAVEEIPNDLEIETSEEPQNAVEEIPNDLEIETSEEPQNAVEEISNDLELVDETTDSLEQTPESLIEIPEAQDSQVFEDQVFEDPQEPEIENTVLISELASSDETFEENPNEASNENLIVVDSIDEIVETLDHQSEESIGEMIAISESESQTPSSELQDQVEVEEFVPEAIAQLTEDINLDLESDTTVELEAEPTVESDIQEVISDSLDVNESVEPDFNACVDEPQTEISSFPLEIDLEIDLANISESPEMELVTEEIITNENISEAISETTDQLEDEALLSPELNKPSLVELEVEVIVSTEIVESSVDELAVETVVSTEIVETFSKPQEQQELLDTVNESINDQTVENFTIEQTLGTSQDEPILEAPEINVLEDDIQQDEDLNIDPVDLFLDSPEPNDQELPYPVVDTTTKADSKGISFLKKARKKGFAQKNYGFGKSVKTTGRNTPTSENLETEETEVDNHEESQVEETVSEVSKEASDTVYDFIESNEEAKLTENVDATVAEEHIEAIEETESIDFDDELDELVTFNIYVENILRQYLDEPSEEITEMIQTEQVDAENPEEQELEDIIEISAVSEQATEIAEEILIAELIQEEESSNQEVEEIVEISAISEQATEIAEEVLISENTLENTIPEVIESPIEDGLNDLDTEAIAPEEDPKYLVQESLVDQFLARIGELNNADKVNKANVEKDLESADKPQKTGEPSDEIDEFADLEALLNNKPLADDSKE